MALTARTPTVTLPVQGRYAADPAHSSVGFSVRHLMVAKVRGRFDGIEATIEVGPTPAESRVEARIDAASIDTGNDMRDNHLRSPDFLDVERFPALTFRSTGFAQTGATSFDLPGEMTIRDVTVPVVLGVEYLGAFTDMQGGRRIAFEATTTIDREAFGITWNQALEAGGVLVGKTVDVSIELQAVLV